MKSTLLLAFAGLGSMALEVSPLNKRQLERIPCDELGMKDCGNVCIDLTDTCCPDEAGGCPASATCELGSNGDYGCCPLGETCTGPGGAITDSEVVTQTDVATESVSVPEPTEAPEEPEPAPKPEPEPEPEPKPEPEPSPEPEPVPSPEPVPEPEPTVTSPTDTGEESPVTTGAAAVNSLGASSLMAAFVAVLALFT